MDRFSLRVFPLAYVRKSPLQSPPESMLFSSTHEYSLPCCVVLQCVSSPLEFGDGPSSEQYCPLGSPPDRREVSSPPFHSCCEEIDTTFWMISFSPGPCSVINQDLPIISIIRVPLSLPYDELGCAPPRLVLSFPFFLGYIF